MVASLSLLPDTLLPRPGDLTTSNIPHLLVEVVVVEGFSHKTGRQSLFLALWERAQGSTCS